LLTFGVTVDSWVYCALDQGLGELRISSNPLVVLCNKTPWWPQSTERTIISLSDLQLKHKQTKHQDTYRWDGESKGGTQ